MSTGGGSPSRPAPPEPLAAPRAGDQAVFVSDASVEAERVAQVLRSRGFMVVDVPLAMLVARAAVQRPRLVLIDADAEGALEAVTRVRELPEGEATDVLFIGRVGVAFGSPEEALAHDGSGFFARPLDVPAVVARVERLLGGTPGSTPPSPPSNRMALPPASMRVDRASQPPPAPSVPRPRVSQPPPPGVSVNNVGAASQRRIPTGALSSELLELLAEAEQRVGGASPPESRPPSPEEEIEAVLPEQILASLDEPLEEDDEDEDAPEMAGGHTRGTTASGGGGPGGRLTTGAVQRHTNVLAATVSQPVAAPGSYATSQADMPTSHGGGAGLMPAPLTPPRPGSEAAPPYSRLMHEHEGPLTHAEIGPGSRLAPLPPRPASVAPALPAPSLAFPTATMGSDMLAVGLAALEARTSPPTDSSPPLLAPPVPHGATPPHAAPSRKAESVPPPPAGPQVLGPGDAARALAEAIAQRATGTLAIDSREGVRRAVLREGDLVTLASGVDDESLIAFLVARGDLPRERRQQLAGRFATFGRHAGAALVAHGHLRQDQLWTVLRAHAEWLLGRAVLVSEGTLVLESEPPGRLRAEPSVFGGSTGAEVFVEVVRRVVAPEEAIGLLGGGGSRLGEGPNAQLLTECALGQAELGILEQGDGHTLEEALSSSRDTDMASVVYALSLLGVLEVLRAGSLHDDAPGLDAGAAADAIDEEAIRGRVRARLALVEEGDYFAVLGVSRNATAYEVRRAFLELRRAFEPSRLLTAATADLAPDVRKVVSVLEEAYEILKDSARRERYRRAIDASPQG